MKTIVISGINLREGGTLTILRDCLEYLSKSRYSKEFRILALVHKKELAEYPNIEYLEFPDSVNSWVKRIYYEYSYFKRLSKKIRPYLWLSLHDMTPNVNAKIRAVYMHNPSIVNKIKLNDFRFNKKYIAFALLYKYLYKINIHKNSYCIVQQEWFKDVCASKLQVNRDRFIVARPNRKTDMYKWPNGNVNCMKFFYPSFPRPFKNFEVICDAALELERRGINDIQISLTIDGSCENYGKWIYSKYHKCKLLNFIGILDKASMNEFYRETDCLIFPSRLETWGLPISEFKSSGRPMIIADEPYAHETAEGAKRVAFFDKDDFRTLADLIEACHSGNLSNFGEVPFNESEGLYADDYEQLFEILLKDLN